MYPKCPICGREMKPYYIKLNKNNKQVQNTKSIYFYCENDGTLAHEETYQMVSMAGYGDYTSDFIYDLPKGYKPTITEKQEIYIDMLADKLHIKSPYVASKEYADKVIKMFRKKKYS